MQDNVSLFTVLSTVYGNQHSSSNNNTNNTHHNTTEIKKDSNVTKISWYSDKNKENENVEQKNQNNENKTSEKVQKTSNTEVKKSNETETGDKDLTLEQILKSLESEKVAKTVESEKSSQDAREKSSQNVENDDEDHYPPVPPPYPYPYAGYPELPSYHNEEPISNYEHATSQNYEPSHFDWNNYPLQDLPAAYFDPNYYPDETFDDSNHLYTDNSYSQDVDKRNVEYENPLDMVYNLNEPVFLDKPCPCSGFGSFDDHPQYKRHAYPFPPFGPKETEGPLKFELPKPQWLEKLKQLTEEKKTKRLFQQTPHVKQRSTDDDEFSPLPSRFFEDETDENGKLYLNDQLKRERQDDAFLS
uniref:CSON014568 protein n=1 Tax=Culicoides sonorensis TaxID=179676 RepID=A0A336MB18_CULSO